MGGAGGLLKTPPRPSPEESESFREVLVEHFGWSFESDKSGLLTDVLWRRARAHQKTCADYLRRLREALPQGAAEWDALAQELTVGETYFFRHREQMAAFLEVALPVRMAIRGKERPLRFLSAGCSSGEEPYSLAMLARQAGLGPEEFQVLALDVNPAALSRARRARFTGWSLRETPEPLRSRWFSKEGSEYVLDPSLLSSVEFRQANLLCHKVEPWRARLYDVIFCRNLLMYLQPERARQVVERLSECLASGGYLFLGHAETLRGLTENYSLLNTHECFYYQRPHAGATWLSNSEPEPGLEALPHDWVEAIDGASERIRRLGHDLRPASQAAGDLQEVRELLDSERYAEALERLGRLPATTREQPETILMQAVLQLHCGRFLETEQLCRRLLEQRLFAAGAHYLLALCREERGDRAAATAEHRAAVRSDPGFAMAHLHLGRLARKDDDLPTARRELEKALLLLQGEDPPRLRLYGGGFPREALVALCQSELKSCR